MSDIGEMIARTFVRMWLATILITVILTAFLLKGIPWVWRHL